MKKTIDEIAKEIASDEALFKFFKEFADGIDILQVEMKYSISTCKIEYLPYIPSDFGNGVNITPVRIHTTQKPYFIQVSKLRIDEKQLKGNSLLFLLYQCIAQNHPDISGNLFKADEVAVGIFSHLKITLLWDDFQKIFSSLDPLASDNPHHLTELNKRRNNLKKNIPPQ